MDVAYTSDPNHRLPVAWNTEMTFPWVFVILHIYTHYAYTGA